MAPFIAPKKKFEERLRTFCLEVNIEQFRGNILTQIEGEAIFKTLDYTKGNKTQAAQLLGITLRTLYNKLAAYQQN